jgi:guanylate kinase
MANTEINKEKINKSKIIILSSPSGAGKTTIANYLAKRNEDMIISVSATTRNRNNSEIEGRDYYFISKEEFLNKISNNELLEYTEIYNNYYGTVKNIVELYIEQGKTIIFDIDWVGHKLIKEKITHIKIISFFIVPPSLEELKNRLIKRSRENPDLIEQRLEQTSKEMKFKDEYNHIVINDSIERALGEIEKIIKNS